MADVDVLQPDATQPDATQAPPAGVSAPPAASAPMQTPPDVPGNHAKLFGMLAGLGVALSAAGKSIGTGGREGGAPDVNAYYQQQAQEKRAEQDQVMRQKDFELRTKAMQAQTNAQVVSTQIALARLPDEMQGAHLGVMNSWMDLAQKMGIPAVVAVKMVPGQSMTEHGDAVKSAMNGDLVGNTAIPAQSGKYGDGQGQTSIFNFDQMAKIDIPQEEAAPMLNKVRNEVELAGSLGVDKKVLDQANATLDSLGKAKTINGKDLWMLTNNIENPIMNASATKQAENKASQESATLKKTQQDSDPVYKLSQPEELAKPGAQASIQAMITDPSTKPQDVPRLQALLPMAKKAQDNAQTLKDNADKAKQKIDEGDPTALGEMMAAGLVAPSQVISARSMSKAFYTNVLKAANVYSMNHGGTPFDVAKADAQFKYATQPQTQNVLNMVDSLEKPGGVADILLEKGKDLPTVGVPVFNSMAQAASYQSGGKAVPAYMPAAVDFADMYAKIMGGGNGTDSARLQALNLVLAAQNPAQRQAAVNTLKETLIARGTSMTRDNPTLRAMYPTLGQTQPVYASAPGKPRVMTTDGGKTWQPAPTQ